MFRSAAEARHAFDAYVRLEPKLAGLWEECEDALPPWLLPAEESDEEDPFEAEDVEPAAPDPSWCAEDYFLHHVKSKLIALVGTHRIRGPRELQSVAAYEAVYDLLMNWALARTCLCCAPADEHEHQAAAAR